MRFKPPAVVEALSDHQKERFFHHLEADFDPSLAEAARQAKINRKQYEQALRTDPEFRARIEDWEATRLGAIEEMAYHLARTGDGAMVRFVLQSKMPQVYGTKSTMNLNVNVRTPDDLKSMTDEQLEEIKRECLP